LSTRLDKDLVADLRVLLFKKDLSMQELFEHFAILLVDGDASATRIVDDLVKTKLKDAIEKKGGKPFKAPMLRERDLSTPDADVIYDMLDEHDPFKRQ
jgi:hypothetical protein